MGAIACSQVCQVANQDYLSHLQKIGPGLSCWMGAPGRKMGQLLAAEGWCTTRSRWKVRVQLIVAGAVFVGDPSSGWNFWGHGEESGGCFLHKLSLLGPDSSFAILSSVEGGSATSARLMHWCFYITMPVSNNTHFLRTSLTLNTPVSASSALEWQAKPTVPVRLL